MSIRKVVSDFIDWEDRAKNRRLANKALTKKVKEVTTSRNGWKTRAMDYKEKYDDVLKKLNSIEKVFKKNFC